MNKILIIGVLVIFCLSGCADEDESVSDANEKNSVAGNASILGTDDTSDAATPGADSVDSECTAGNVTGNVLSFKSDTTPCAYSNYSGEYVFDDLIVAGENSNTFLLLNRSATDGSGTGCEKDGCKFVCNRYWLGGVEVDGDKIDSTTGETTGIWASIEYELDLWGTLDENGIASVEGTLRVSCSGELCNESDCQSDMSGAITVTR